jgi:phosphoadenosine phosphosulfate reductase
MTLAEKIEESRSILSYAMEQFGAALALTFSGGKDSLVVLHLTRSLNDGQVPFPVFSIDTTLKFPETMKFRDYIASLWNLDLVILTNPEAPKLAGTIQNKQECCRVLKIQPLKEAIVKYNLKGLITAIRWDEQEARTQEEPFSPRDNPPHTRIHPILHFTEADIWDYIHAFDLPYCELYDQGYRSLSCLPCTAKSQGEGSERMGRSPDKEALMKNLRSLGYF